MNDFASWLQSKDLKGVEILVHNLSHSDLVFSVNDSNLSYPQCKLIARPKFSHFAKLSEKILNVVTEASKNNRSIPITEHQKYTRHVVPGEVQKYQVLPSLEGTYAPVGFDLADADVPVKISQLRFRRDDRLLLGEEGVDCDQQETDATCRVDAAYFPLMAVLLQKWLRTIQWVKSIENAADRNHVTCVIILVSGRGTPVDFSNAAISDNSTEFTARLLIHFIQRLYPNIQIIHVHSNTNLFRYDENILFVKQELLPKIDFVRNELARRLGEGWKEALRVTLSFADGSSARVSAINAALRYYRPSYMHFWQLKTFWYEAKVCEDDIEWHSFEQISTEPAIPLNAADKTSWVGLVVREMIKFRHDFERVRSDQQSSDLSSFWLRKSKKPVLSVLLVQKEGQPARLYRGTNMEVSMPTGSLCAERNVIGSALADDLTLRRQDLRIIAVYAGRSLDSKTGSQGLAVQESIDVDDTPESMAFSPPRTDTRYPVSPRNNDDSSNRQLTGKPPLTRRLSETSEHERDNAFAGSLATSSLDLSASQDDVGGGVGGGAVRSPPVGSKRKIMNIPIGGSSQHTSFVLAGQSNTSVSAFQVSQLPSDNSSPPKKKVAVTMGGSPPIHSTPNPNLAEILIPALSAPVDETATRRLRSGSKSSSLSPFSKHKEVSAKRTIRLATHGEQFLSGLSSARSVGSEERLATTISYSSNNSIGSNNSNPADLSPATPSLTASDSVPGNGVLTEEQRANVLFRQYGLRDDDDVVTTCGTCRTPVMNGNEEVSGVEQWTITVNGNDLNPLKPCGACHEWLKKIAEVNPEFSVITFTDENFAGMFVEQIRD